jgi:hypothetical protein
MAIRQVSTGAVITLSVYFSTKADIREFPVRAGHIFALVSHSVPLVYQIDVKEPPGLPELLFA